MNAALEEVAIYVRQLADEGLVAGEMFRRCAAKYPALRRQDFSIALHIAIHDETKGNRPHHDTAL